MTTDHERLATFAEVEHGLEGVLMGLLADPARWILVLRVEGSLNKYAQFLLYEDGERLVAEAVSNVNLDPVEQWDLDEEIALLGLGWDPPTLPKSPNFRRIDEAPADVREVAQMALATLRDVFTVKDGDALRIKLFRSPLSPKWEQACRPEPSCSRSGNATSPVADGPLSGTSETSVADSGCTGRTTRQRA